MPESDRHPTSCHGPSGMLLFIRGKKKQLRAHQTNNGLEKLGPSVAGPILRRNHQSKAHEKLCVNGPKELG